MFYYYGVPKQDVIAALGDLLTLLETHSPGPHTQAQIDKLRAQGIPDALAQKTDPAAFANLLQRSGLNDFLIDTAFVMRFHQRFDTDGKARRAYNTLHRTGQLYALPGGPNMMDPHMLEGYFWCAVAYADKLAQKNKLSRAWNSLKLTSEQKQALADMKDKPLNLPHTPAELLTVSRLTNALETLCGFDPEGDDMKRMRRAFNDYITSATFPHGIPPEEKNLIISRQEMLKEHLEAMQETTRVSNISPFRAVDIGVAEHRGLTFRATEQTARALVRHHGLKITNRVTGKTVPAAETPSAKSRPKQ